MQIIVVGCGKVGVTVVEQLSRENHDITIVDLKSDSVNRVSTKYDAQGVIGNAMSLDVLNEAGVGDSDLLISVTHSDEMNILCCLIAKNAGVKHTIARVRNPIYGKESEFIRQELGISMIINPEYAAAMEISRLLRFPSAIQIETFAKGRIEILKFRVKEESVLVGLSVKDIAVKLHCDVLVCYIEHGEQAVIPNGDVIIRENDLISIVAEANASSSFFKKIGLMKHPVKDTMIIGGGDIAVYLAKMLLKMGIRVKIFEKSIERCDELCEIVHDAMVINGDGTDKQLLTEEGLNTTDSFVALTNIDEENVLLSLFAKTKTQGKLITKINSISFNDIINNMTLDSIVYPKNITADYILQYVRGMQKSIGSNIETLYQLSDGKVEALEFLISGESDVVDVPLEKLDIKDNLLLCCIKRDNEILIPRGQDRIYQGDTVIIVTTQTGLNDITDILK